MKISTSLFGEIEIQKDKVISFDNGIPAFPEETSFIILHDEEDENNILSWLQSTNDPQLTFAIIDILRVMPTYSPLISEEDLFSIGEYEKSDFFIYSIATVPDTVTDITVNLKGPIIINAKTCKGRQVIAENDDYPIRFNIFEAIQKRK